MDIENYSERLSYVGYLHSVNIISLTDSSSLLLKVGAHLEVILTEVSCTVGLGLDLCFIHSVLMNSF